MQITATLKGAKKFNKKIGAEKKRQKKAFDTAMRVEAFRLMKLLKKEISAGAPGGKKFKDLSYIARRLRYRGRNAPMKTFAKAVRYHIADRDPIELHIGFAGPKVSKRWKYLAKKQQEGFDSGDMPEGRRRYLARIGGRLGARAKGKKFLFLKKSTRRFKTPARPMIAPFWDGHQAQAWRNVRRNFKRKLKGERI
jgi:hypothetical protein